MTWLWRGPQVAQIADSAARHALSEVAEVLLEESNRTIPHQSGTMMRSGITSHSDPPQKPLAMVSYDTPYAVRQHEDTRLQHPNGRRAEWLRRTLEENRQRYLAWIRGALDRRLR
jgi:hypothetical protein